MIEALLDELSKQIWNGDQVSAILNHPAEYPKELIEKLSLATALGYWNGSMNYREADCIINNFYIYWMTHTEIANSAEFFGIAWECYLAFDEGEYYHRDDDIQIDPEEKYTRPMIEALLRKQKLIR